ncbi:uncharacterized protein LOC130046397 isoform X1 [Ostrea edulis]|uniref:uncharacterized protein LOC130046397 isoform X1 n=1 Tax=Ostrea edulis TaxID=37623 RepID=UPI0024AEFB25|nr:uncharacterized protein LOC130046397 isoform X1 [Ostrea edulis]
MEQRPERIVCLVIIVMTTVTLCDKSIFDWVPKDNYGKIDGLMVAIQKSTDCKAKTQQAMTLPKDSVSQIPRANQLLNKIWYKNRTALVHMHNMALNRAYFYSYIFQKLNKTQTDFQYQPGWFYNYVSVTADTNANKEIFNASALMFDNHNYYPNWMTNFDFNKTLPLFGVRSFRFDDTFDMGVILREPTERTTLVQDIGAIGNYTDNGYKMAPWYSFWLPDNEPTMDSVQKFTYAVNVKYANGTGRWLHDEFQTTPFFGPNSPGIGDTDDMYMPVRFTDAYFDCKMSNKWIVSAVAPIVDFMPRYSNWTHLRRPKFVGVAVMDIDFLEVDFNACPVSIGNPGPSFLSGVSKCKTKTTQCKHVSGKGFKRGAYTCICNSGYSYPPRVGPPWKGGDLEKATEFEISVGYKCRPTGYLRVLPVVDTSALNVKVERDSGSDPFLTDRFNGRQLRSVNASQFYGPVRREAVRKTQQPRPIKREIVKKDYIDQDFKRKPLIKKQKRKRKRREAQFDQMNFDRMQGIFQTIKKINRDNCKTFSNRAMLLPGDVGYGVEKQFDTQARFALRISHLLSIWFQNVMPGENFGYLKGGNRIHNELMFGEVLANVMADYKVLSSGIYFEPHVFEDWDGKSREFFGPFAWKRDKSVYAIDMGGFKKRYIDEDWYVRIRQRWQTNTAGVKKYRMKAKVRSDIKGSSSVNFEYYPMGYKAPSVTHGIWTQPYFRCDGRVDAWVITYAVPFIGLDRLRTKLKFKGVVTVDIPLEELEINQCYQSFSIQNAFKNTARCHYPSQTCSPIAGYKFSRGAYECACRQGYEYPFKDGRNFFQGSLVDIEYEKKMAGLFSLFDSLKCRTQGVSMVICNTITLVVMAIIAVFSKNI